MKTINDYSKAFEKKYPAPDTEELQELRDWLKTQRANGGGWSPVLNNEIKDLIIKYL